MSESTATEKSAEDKAAVARALAAIERRPEAAETLRLLTQAYQAPIGHIIGVTGPPGVGKSTLVRALIQDNRQRGLSVAVVAVDPSSRQSGGALLGDRVRLGGNPEDEGLFIRSMAARDRLGGLADITWSAAIYLRARYDRVIVETVGVGQSETDVAGLADTVVFCVQPGSGDVLQFMKAGIAEIPHVAVVTKADMGAPAHKAESDLREALPAKARDGNDIEILRLGLQDPCGVAPLTGCLERRWCGLQAEPDRLMSARSAQAERWLQEAVRTRYGREGLKRCGELSLSKGEAPFERLARISGALSRNLPTRVCGA